MKGTSGVLEPAPSQNGFYVYAQFDPVPLQIELLCKRKNINLLGRSP